LQWTDHKVPPDHKEYKGILGHKECKETKAYRVLPGHRVILDPRVYREILDHRGHRATLVHRVFKDYKEIKDPKVLLATLVHKDHRAILDPRVFKDYKDPRGRQALKGLRENPDSAVLRFSVLTFNTTILKKNDEVILTRTLNMHHL
jgi:hypothetical protein